MNFLLRYIILLAWMALIFLLSHESADGSQARSDVFGDVLLLGDVTVRKLAHVALYVILGGLVTWTLALHIRATRRLVAWSMLACIVYAISDELHQLMIPGRSGELRDALIDTAGAIVGVTLVAWLQVVRRRYSRAIY